MTTTRDERIRELLVHLACLDGHRCGDDPQVDAAREAILDELRSLAMADGLAVVRRGRNLDAVSMVG